MLILDEPTNDLDTDMLAAMEDLLDSWPGTLIVVSHDRYLLERVTDQQYAILDKKLRHLPGRCRRVPEAAPGGGAREGRRCLGEDGEASRGRAVGQVSAAREAEALGPRAARRPEGDRFG